MADDQQYQDENRSAAKTLWLGDVQPDWTEEYVESLFSSIGQELEVKLIRDRHRGIVAGYGFIDFRNHETAQLVLDSLNGKPIEGTSLRYRLNWGAGGKRIEQAPEYSVFVGDLSPEVTDAELKATFLDKYASVLGAKVVTNPMTGSSKSFGFIRFGDEQERDEALTAMNGAECCGRPIRVAPATKRTSVQGQTGAHATDPSNTTVFVGGINDSVTEKVLRDTFNSAGEIQTVTTPPGRGCAFVTFAHRASAEHVINNMQGTTVCGSCVRLSWGKSGRADRDRERERAGGDPIMGMGGIQPSPTAAAAAAAAAARGAPFSGLYGHPQSYASFNGAYPANLFPAGAVYGGAYPQPGQQQPGLPPPAAAGTGQQLPQPQQPQQPQQPHQHQQAAQQQAQQQVAAQQQQQQQQAAQQQYAQQPYSQQSYAPYQGFGFQQYPAQQQAAYTSFNGNNTAYAQDPSALANDISQLSLSGGAASAVGGSSGGASVGGGAGGRAARVAGSRSGGGGGMYGPASRSGGQGQGPGPGQGGQGPSFSLQDVRKGGLGPASRN